MKLKLALLFISMFGLAGCGVFKPATGEGPSTIFCTDDQCDQSSIEKYEAKPVETFAVVNQGQVLKSMMSCTGLETASNNTQNTYRNSLNSFSLEGGADTVGAPMWMAITSLAGEVCRDLVNQERGQSAAERKIFSSVDFGQGISSLNTTIIADVVRKMARSCWGRNETSQEMGVIFNNFTGTFPTNGNATETRNAAMFLCTGMLGSLSANQM